MNSIIESLNAWGARFFELTPTMLWQSSLLIAIVFAIDFTFRRKLRAAIRYALWLVVLVKLILPPTLALPTGIAWWLRSRPIVTSQPVTRPMRVTYANSVTSEPDPEPAPAAPAPPPPAPHLTKSGRMLMTSASISALLFAWLIFRWVQIVRLIRRASSASPTINDLLSAIKPPTKLSRAVRVRTTIDPISPAVCGLFRPVVLLPQSLVDKLNPEQLRAVLLHELIHLRRLDVWVNFAQSLLQISYWWHPLLWLANARIRRVREEAVDDAVILALREDSEVYAPTLLKVAKLAFNRPLASLGLVGILESRNALRQRIERLLSNTPRRAGLSIVSILGIAAFAAVAVPMAEGPARIIDGGSDLNSVDSTNLIPYSAKVDPEVFIRNIKARAGETMHTTNDFWGDILLSILDGYGIDCTPPRAIGLNNKTGELTTQNSPQALQVLDQVIRELNLPGGERILNPPYGLKQVLIEAQIYQMRSSDLAQLDLASHHHSYHQANESPWWDIVESNDVGWITAKLKEMGVQPIGRPRIQTSHGIAASLFIGDNTNNIELECRPMIQDGSVDMTVLARTTGSYAPKGGWPDFAGWTNCAIFSRVGVLDGCGAILESEHPGDASDSKLVVLLRAKILKRTAATSPNASVRSGATTGQTLTQSISAKQLVQDGKLLFQLGKMDEAKAKLNEALKSEPENQAALYYLNLISQNREKIAVESTNITPGIHNLPNVTLPREKTLEKLITNSTDHAESPELFTRTFKVNTNAVFVALRRTSFLKGTNFQTALAEYFKSAGAEVTPPQTFFFNDRQGLLTVRAGAKVLDSIEAAIDTLNAPAPQVNIKARFVEISAVRDSAGKIHAMDSDFTSALKKLLAADTKLNTHHQTDTLTGILTESQMRDVLKVLQKSRHGTLLNEGQVTTLSERQAQFEIAAVMTIVNGLNVDIKNTPTTAVIETNYNFQTTNMTFGVTLDVVPVVAKDNSSVSMTLIPRVTEFLGYQKPDELSEYDKNLKRAQFPLPEYRERTITTAVTVPNRGTLVLGSLSDDVVSEHLDGSLSRKQFSNPPYKTYKQLLVFVTPTIVDAAGNPAGPIADVSSAYPPHSEDYYDFPTN